MYRGREQYRLNMHQSMDQPQVQLFSLHSRSMAFLYLCFRSMTILCLCFNLFVFILAVILTTSLAKTNTKSSAIAADHFARGGFCILL